MIAKFPRIFKVYICVLICLHMWNYIQRQPISTVLQFKSECLGNSATYCYKIEVTLFVIIPLVFGTTILIFLTASVC